MIRSGVRLIPGRRLYTRGTAHLRWSSPNMVETFPLRGLLLSVAALLLAGCVEVQSERPRFAQKNCLDCHKTFAQKYLGMKAIHPAVKAQQCETCHLRHGLIPKAVMKKDGNELCFQCHARDKVGLSRRHVHTALNAGRCTACHDPHASPAAGGHNPHPSAQAKLLKASAHSPVAGGQCEGCHEPASSPKPFATSQAADTLCATCHPPPRPPRSPRSWPSRTTPGSA